MPTYRIVSELDPGPDHRDFRGERLRLDEARLVTTHRTSCLAEATTDARDTEPHRERRIVSVEEVHPGLTVSDAEISEALTSPDAEAFYGTHETPPPLLDPEDFDDVPDACDYESQRDLLNQVTYGLRESGLVPGLDLSILNNDDRSPYVMVEVFDDARGIHLSRGSDLDELLDTKADTGWRAVVATAHNVIQLVNDLH